MEGVDRRGSQAKVVWRYTRPLGITRAAHGRARRRKRAAEGWLGGWGGFHLRRHLSRRDPERAAGLQLRDAPGRQEDLGVAGDHAIEGRGWEDHPDGHRAGRVPRRLRRRGLSRARHRSSPRCAWGLAEGLSGVFPGALTSRARWGAPPITIPSRP